LLQLHLNLALYFGERFEMSVLLIFEVDDVEAIARLDQIAGLTFGK
jgi:chemotaxis protein CheY-P-specific phosphatase CheC